MVTVMEGAEPDQEIFRVLATDVDSGELGTIRYGISPSTDTPTRHYFKVDPGHSNIIYSDFSKKQLNFVV